MALIIEYTENGRKRRVFWHYSEPLPESVLRERVLNFFADGDELDLLLGAIRATIKPTVTIDVTPGTAPQLTEGDSK
jgi:hypothetical protein